jgi:hypothetical protein
MEVAMDHSMSLFCSLMCLVTMLATSCGNSPSRATTTSPAIPVSATPAAREREADRPLGDVGADAAVENRSDVRIAAGSAATVAEESSRVADGLRVRRLIVALGVEDREPVGAASRFDAGNDRIYSFMELANESETARQVVVTFERDDGTSVGHIAVNVPARVPRWRTWAWSNRVNTPGTWTAVVSTPDGTELGRERFEVEG